jgi:hypothetical protein
MGDPFSIIDSRGAPWPPTLENSKTKVEKQFPDSRVVIELLTKNSCRIFFREVSLPAHFHYDLTRENPTGKIDPTDDGSEHWFIQEGTLRIALGEAPYRENQRIDWIIKDYSKGDIVILGSEVPHALKGSAVIYVVTSFNHAGLGEIRNSVQIPETPEL